MGASDPGRNGHRLASIPLPPPCRANTIFSTVRPVKMTTNADDLVVEKRTEGVFRVNTSVYTQRNILEKERDRIFNSCWLYFGHEEELSSPGSFLVRRISNRSILVIKGLDGVIRGFHNTCIHRGTMICREPSGIAKRFVCPYHGWTYSDSGRLLGSPAGYDPKQNAEGKLGLTPVPHLSSRQGFIFINLGSRPASLADYLGQSGPFLDLVAAELREDFSKLEIVDGMRSHEVAANWKITVENHAADTYHQAFAHRRLVDFGRRIAQGFAANTSDANDFWRSAVGAMVAKALAQGHHWTVFDQQVALEIIRKELRTRLPGLIDFQYTRKSYVLFIFPNLVLQQDPILGTVWRSFTPVAEDKTEICTWLIGKKDEAAEERIARVRAFNLFWGPTGFAVPDDFEIFELVQRGIDNGGLEWMDFSYNLHQADPSDSVDASYLLQRNFWKRWHELTASEDAHGSR
jgi:p-cumate 2,3-dioxygenase alpha subunit